MLREFDEYLKRHFKNLKDEEIFCITIGAIPDNLPMGIEDGELTLTREDMLSIFDPIINQILSLVQEQIDMVEVQNQEKSRISV